MEVVMMVCPFCGMSRPLNKTGSRMFIERGIVPDVPKGRSRFDKLDPKTAPFIDIREALGGKGAKRFHTVKRGTAYDRRQQLERDREAGQTGGFKRVKYLTLEQAKDNPEYSDLIDQLREQAREVLEVLG